MKNFGNLFKIRLKVRFRELDFVFITTALPVIIVVLNSSISSEMGIEWFLPGGIAMVISITSLMGCLSSLVSDKSRGMLKMMCIVSASPAIYLTCELLITFVFIMLSTGILTGITTALGARIFGLSVLPFIIIVVGTFALMLLSLMIAGFIRNEKLANALTSVLGSTLVILSFPPLELFPSTFASFVRILPSVLLSDVLRDVMMGDGVLADNLINIGILVAWSVASAIVLTRTFKWE